MASKELSLRNFAWISLVPQLILLGAIIVLFTVLEVPHPVLLGGLTCVLLSLALKMTITSAYRKGVDHANAKKFEAAIPWFDRSTSFFQRHPWLDRYRYLLLLSSSAWSYREMSLVNRAFCIGRSRSAEECYQAFDAVLLEFPESVLAKTTRRFMYANDTHH